MTNYETWQLETKGDIIPVYNSIAPANDYDRILEDRQNTIHETEVNNLLNECYE